MEADEEDNKPARHPQKRVRRKEVLARKKAMEEIIRAASSQKDHLASFFLALITTRKVNMEAPFGSEWPVEEKVKRKEMVAPEVRYIFVYEDQNADSTQMPLAEKEKSASYEGRIVGFVHYRFILEEEVLVLYVYELQLEAIVQGKGLGSF